MNRFRKYPSTLAGFMVVLWKLANSQRSRGHGWQMNLAICGIEADLGEENAYSFHCKVATVARDSGNILKTMRRAILTLLLSGALLDGLVSAAPVTEQKAWKAAETFIVLGYPALGQQVAQTVTPVGKSHLAVRRVRTLVEAGRVIAFVADLKPSGYILLRADDETPVIKLHTDAGEFDRLPPEFVKVVKSELSEELGALADLKKLQKVANPKHAKLWQALTSAASDPAELRSITPFSPSTILLSTTWNQDAPYNYYCPTATGGPGGRTDAGCTACALSQILRYWNHPSSVAQDHTYTDSSHLCQGTHSISDAGMGAYDWVNMPNSIYRGSPTNQMQAIGQLMYHAAAALNSDFEASATSAQAGDIPPVLQDYFIYTSGGYESKTSYTDSQWYNKIAADIDAGKPIFYAMWQADFGGGHAAVCDGYQSGNQIHLNLGWSGSGNAWYNLDSVSSGGYTWTIHGAVFMITPASSIITTPSTLLSGTVGMGFSQTFTLVGEAPPYTWSLDSGSLPSGLNLSSNGVITGTPTGPTQASFVLRATGTNGLYSTKMFALAINSADVINYAWANLAGKPGSPGSGSTGSSDGTGTEARFYYPAGVAAGSAGDAYVADTENSTIRKVTASGVVTTIAGSEGQTGSADGTNNSARFNKPYAVAVDGAGILYVADSNNHIIRQVVPVGTNWVVTTLAGVPGAAGNADGTNTAARFNYPYGIAVDTAGNLYVADCFNNTLRKIVRSGGNWVVSTLAGGFSYPFGVAVDGAGNVFLSDYGHWTIRKVTAAGVVTTIAGSQGQTGSADGTNNAARFYCPRGVAVDSAGNVYVADECNYAIRKIQPVGTNWVVSTIGGSSTSYGTADGTNTAARFTNPEGVAVDNAGNVYVADTYNSRISRGTPFLWQPTITTGNPLPPGKVGVAYSRTLAASNGVMPYTWSITSNGLPAGLTIVSGTGAINGTPMTYGTSTFTVRCAANGGSYAEKSFSLTINPTARQAWQLYYFGCTDCPQAADDADPDGDGQDNNAELLAGTDPTNSASVFRITSIATEGNNVRIAWTTVGGKTNVLEAGCGTCDNPDDPAYSNLFWDMSGPIIIPGNGDVATNFFDDGTWWGDYSNWPVRFYRVRLVP